jgi:hypothetical protein
MRSVGAIRSRVRKRRAISVSFRDWSRIPSCEVNRGHKGAGHTSANLLGSTKKASSILLRGASCRLTGCFAEQVTGYVDQCEPPPLLRMRLGTCLNEYLHGLLAGVYFNPQRSVTKINFMTAAVLSSNDGMRHFRFHSDG